MGGPCLRPFTHSKKNMFGFNATSIQPYNSKAIDNMTQPSNIYITTPNNNERGEKEYMLDE